MRSFITVVLGFVALSLPTLARADPWFLSPGIKLGYTFGGGFTYGAEVSAVFPIIGGRGPILLGGGVLAFEQVLGGPSRLRLSGQVNSVGFGVESGPAVVYDGSHFAPAWTATPWVGAFVIPYATFSFVRGMPNSIDVGTNLKWHFLRDFERWRAPWEIQLATPAVGP